MQAFVVIASDCEAAIRYAEMIARSQVPMLYRSRKQACDYYNENSSMLNRYRIYSVLIAPGGYDVIRLYPDGSPSDRYARAK